MSDLFIGVVSHDGSRYQESQGPSGLAARLGGALSDRGVRVSIAVNSVDLFGGTVSPGLVQTSLTAQMSVEEEWARFLQRPRGFRSLFEIIYRRCRRLRQRLQPPDPRTIVRLLNIELSHLDLMRRGRASGAGWVLIMEDDGECMDVDDLASGLVGLTAELPEVAFANISDSFDSGQLGARHLLRSSAITWQGTAPRRVLESERPVTNTVCAMLYSAEFLRALLPAWDALPLEPVVPVDWKLNVVLMHLYESGDLRFGSCVLVEPAPIAQGSMRNTGILPT